MLRAAAASVLYLALIALLSLGTATAVRDSAVAIGSAPVPWLARRLFPLLAATALVVIGMACTTCGDLIWLGCQPGRFRMICGGRWSRRSGCRV